LAEDVLREVLANLLDNAVRHAKSSIEVALTRTADQVLVTVADDGPGVPAEEAERVFERFMSHDGGLGLGLALSRAAARAVGGELRWEPGCFVLRLPAYDELGRAGRRPARARRLQPASRPAAVVRARHGTS
jgi:signal transduction histidine kinase